MFSNLLDAILLQYLFQMSGMTSRSDMVASIKRIVR